MTPARFRAGQMFGDGSLMEKRSLPSPLRPTSPAGGVASLPNYRHPSRPSTFLHPKDHQGPRQRHPGSGIRNPPFFSSASLPAGIGPGTRDVRVVVLGWALGVSGAAPAQPTCFFADGRNIDESVCVGISAAAMNTPPLSLSQKATPRSDGATSHPNSPSVTGRLPRCPKVRGLHLIAASDIQVPTVLGGSEKEKKVTNNVHTQLDLEIPPRHRAVCDTQPGRS